jgi:hypothetical protein
MIEATEVEIQTTLTDIKRKRRTSQPASFLFLNIKTIYYEFLHSKYTAASFKMQEMKLNIQKKKNLR